MYEDLLVGMIVQGCKGIKFSICHKDVWDVRTFVNIFLNETLFCESL